MNHNPGAPGNPGRRTFTLAACYTGYRVGSHGTAGGIAKRTQGLRAKPPVNDVSRFLLSLLTAGSFPMRLHSTRPYAVGLMLLAAAGSASAQSTDKAPDNGTDPTRMSTSAALQYEYFALREGASTGTWKLSYTQPLGEKRDYSLRLRVPVMRNTVLGNDGYGLGDVQLQLAHVFGVSRKGGMVVQGEVAFDSAKRPELGSGKTVLKGTFIYARFLSDGGILAPALVHSASVGGNAARPTVNVTTLDLYYVPHLSNPGHFMTVDPAVTRDWQGKKQFASLAVTFGSSIGAAFGGNAQVFVKPTLFAGGDRPAKWGLELGYKVIGF